jgi:creatinine amidohydrolase
MVKIRWDEMRWPEIEELAKVPNVIILPVGSVEQHGRHLPLNTDTITTVNLAERVATRVTEEHGIRTVVLPYIPYGEAGGWPSFSKLPPGTITVRGDTVMNLVEDVVRSLISQGFRNIFVLNGHLENAMLITVALRRVSLDFPDMGLYGANWFQLAAETWSKLAKGGKAGAGHACEKETAVGLYLQPQNVDMKEAIAGTHHHSLPAKYILPPQSATGTGPVFFHSRIGGLRAGGIMADPSCGTAEAGEKYMSAVLDDLTDIVVAIAKSEEIKPEEKLK